MSGTTTHSPPAGPATPAGAADHTQPPVGGVPAGTGSAGGRTEAGNAA
jgi:hypothetical protein